MKQNDWLNHIRGYIYDNSEMMCTVRDEGYDRSTDPCHCHMEPDDMPETFRAKVHYVLLSDVGK